MSIMDRNMVKTTARSSRTRDVENFIVIWLDSTISESNEDTQNSIRQLRCIVNSIKTFTNSNQCIDYIIQIEHEKIFLIISGSLCQNLVSILDDITQIESIYVFCKRKSKHESWANQHRKIKNVFNKIEPICHVLKQDVRQSETNLIPISIISSTSTELNKLDQSFMYSQLLKEIILESEYNDKVKTELIDFCREQYAGNNDILDIIDEFEQKYNLSSPIWWYTRECFIYSMMNKALRTQDIEIILKMGFFIQDIHQQIEKLYLQSHNKHSFTVYRGQGISNKDLEKMKNNKGSLLSFNTFLSTSLSRKTSLEYARQALKNSDLIAIIFRMEIDPSISSTPFASLDNISYYSNEEKEILFSMHTVFRIGNISQIEDRLWQINLTLTTDHDQQLTQLTEHMRKEIEGGTGLHRMGKLMIAMGEFKQAEKIYVTLSGTISDDDDRQQQAIIYHQLGYIYDQLSQLSKGLTYYRFSLDIALTDLSSNDPKLSATYTGIGLVLQKQGDMENALKNFTLALKSDLHASHTNQLQVATHYNNIGGVLVNQKKYSEALENFQHALKIKLRCLPPYHSSLATTYNNIGSVYYTMKDYSTALSYYEKTLEIEGKSLPDNHPSLAITHINIATAYDGLHRYEEAIEHIKQAIEISHRSFNLNHPQVQKYQHYLNRCQRKLIITKKH